MEKNSSNELPKGWINVPLGNILSLEYGKGLVKNKRDNFGQVPVYGSSGIVDHHSESLTKKPCIIIGRKGSIGSTYLSTTPCWVIDTAYYIEPPEEIDLKFLFYLLSHMNLKKLDKSTTIPSLVRRNAYELTIPLAPYAEQKRIVAKIEELIQQCNSVKFEIKKIYDLLKRFRQSLLISAFNGNLVSQSYSDKPVEELLRKISRNMSSSQNMDVTNKKIGNTEHNVLPPNFIEQHELPKGWCWTKIGMISLVIRGASPRPAGDSRYFGGNIPWITVGSITNDENIYLTNVSEFVTDEGRIRSRYIEPETLLLTNSGATLGIPKITKIGGCINDGSVALLNLDNPLKTYLYYYFLSLTKKLRSINQGAAQPNLNTGIVKSISVPVAPIQEQFRIVSKLEEMFGSISQVNSVITEIEKRIDMTSRLILEKAFTGKLVSQDPTDESASILFERIKQRK